MKRMKLKRSERKLAFFRLTINQFWSSQNLEFIAWSSTEAPFFTFFNQRQMVRRSVITFSLKTWRLSARKWRRKFAHGSKAHFHSIWNIVPESTFPIQQLISLFCQALCIEASRYENLSHQKEDSTVFVVGRRKERTPIHEFLTKMGNHKGFSFHILSVPTRNETNQFNGACKWQDVF